MIPVMVTLAQIMSETSHLLYHNPNCSIHEMSQIAMAIDKKLLDWKANLPKFLNLDAASLNDPEWASKQKLVLKLRKPLTYRSKETRNHLLTVRRTGFYNARILIHRPFLVASTSTSTSSSSSSTIDGIYLQHIPICLVAARANIQMQYESFLHKLYVRTWFVPYILLRNLTYYLLSILTLILTPKRWYNTTYALYATMILLHLLLSGSSTTSNAATTPTLDVPEDDLVKDVEKTLDIVTSMNNLLAARRCAELIREVLDVAKTCLARRRRIRGHSQSSFLPTADAAPTAISPSNTFRAEAGQNPATSTTIPISPFSISQPGPGSPGLGSDPAAAATAAAPVFGTGTGSGMSSADGDFFSSLFMGQDSEDGGAGDEARAGVLANLVDPGILEDFVFGGGNDVFRY